ncbi:hypothetical protein BDV18DRAFT_162522 [Aspergillus unguis]
MSGVHRCSIYEMTIACRSCLQQCIDKQQLAEDEWARKRLADFNLWAAGSGASASDRASLDQRLTRHPSVKSVVVNLLCLLQALLSRCLREDITDSELFGANRATDTDGSDDDLDELRGPGSIHTTNKETEGIINQLIRISIAVRRAAESRLEGCAEHNPFSFQPTEVQSRLIRANLRRRHRFLYAEKRWKKQGGERNTAMAEEGLLCSGPQRKEQAVTEAKTHKDEPTWSRSVMGPAPAPTSTAPTTIQEPVVVPESSQPSMTLASTTRAKVSYPSAPEIPDGHQAFTCPCCYLSLPVSLSEGRKWRKHLAEDICPYTCILDNCPQPEKLYSNRTEWTDHMLHGHPVSRYWLCFACPNPNKFTSDKVFVDHLVHQPGDDIPESQISMFVQECAYNAPLAVPGCPLCPQDRFDPDTESGTLLDHIAEHIHSFSLRTLPWPLHGMAEQAYVGSYNGTLGPTGYFKLVSEDGSSKSARPSLISEGSEERESAHEMGFTSEADVNLGPSPAQTVPDAEFTNWQDILQGREAPRDETHSEPPAGGEVDLGPALESFISNPPTSRCDNSSADLELFISNYPLKAARTRKDD